MKGVSEASKDLEQIKKWWSLWPDSNIGIATGLLSGIVVLDIDNDDETGENGAESLLEWARGIGYDLPDTWKALSGGGGMHFIYRSSKEIRNRIKVLPGVDVRGDGGYIVAPPSLHVSGRRYEWEVSPDEMPEPIPLPLEIESLMSSQQSSGSFSFTVTETVAEGARNTTMFKLASSLKAKGLSYEAILAAVSAENAQRCSPALEVREIETICRSVEKYKAGETLNQMQMAAGAEAAIEQVAISGTVESLVSNETMGSIFAISDELERARKIMTLRKRAQELKCVRGFDTILKTYSEQAAQSKEQCGNKTNFTGAPLALFCGDYEATNAGIVGPENNVCPHPILPIASLTDADTGLEKTELVFSRNGVWKQVIVNRSTLASRTAIISLADRGVAVNSENAKFLIQYFADVEAMNEGLIPRYSSVSNLGWAGSQFSPYMPDLKFSGDEAFKGLFEAVRCEGNYDLWKETVLKAKTLSFTGRIALNASFAAPLVGMLRKLIFFVHFWGGTGKAKTVALMLAMSVWGNPELSNGLLRTFNATSVGLERLAGFMRSMPLALDELQCKTGYKRNFEGIIYMLGQGQGRTRGRKAGGIETILTWRNCIISTGEQPLTDDHSGGGAKNRVIDVYCKDAIFHDAPAIAGAVQENYGWVGKEYIEGLMQQGVKPRAEQLYDSFYSNISADNVSTEKQAMETAMLVLGEYFSDIFVFHMQKEDASQAAQEFANGIKQFITDSADVDDIARIYDWIIGGIASNQPKFTLSSPDYNEIWGEKEDDGSYWIISTKLSEALENTGFSYRKALAGLAEREKIEVFQCKDGKTEYTRCKRIGSANPRMVHLFTNGGGWEEVSGGDIPNEFL